MCETRIVRRGTPIARAARTKSFPFCPSTDPRRSRAKIGTLTTPIAIMIEKSPGPSIAAMPMAMRSPGIESMMSISRMITLSVLPPKKPGHRAEQEPDRHSDTDGDDADEERETGPVDDARELVSAELVDAEPVLGRGSGTAAVGDQAQSCSRDRTVR